jgi:hypothetical protein
VFLGPETGERRLAPIGAQRSRVRLWSRSPQFARAVAFWMVQTSFSSRAQKSKGRFSIAAASSARLAWRFCSARAARAVSSASEAQRTRHGLDLLWRRGHYLRVAVLACNEATDLASVAHRAEVAHELLTAVSAVGFGRLLLSARNCASMQLRGELLSLSGALRQRLQGSPATVSVRFGGASEGRQGLPQRSVRKCLAEPAGPRPMAARS